MARSAVHAVVRVGRRLRGPPVAAQVRAHDRETRVDEFRCHLVPGRVGSGGWPWSRTTAGPAPGVAHAQRDAWADLDVIEVETGKITTHHASTPARTGVATADRVADGLRTQRDLDRVADAIWLVVSGIRLTANRVFRSLSRCLARGPDGSFAGLQRVGVERRHHAPGIQLGGPEVHVPDDHRAPAGPRRRARHRPRRGSGGTAASAGAGAASSPRSAAPSAIQSLSRRREASEASVTG